MLSWSSLAGISKVHVLNLGVAPIFVCDFWGSQNIQVYTHIISPLRNPNVFNQNFLLISNFIFLSYLMIFTRKCHDSWRQLFVVTVLFEPPIFRILHARLGICCRSDTFVELFLASPSRLRTWPDDRTMINPLPIHTNEETNASTHASESWLCLWVRWGCKQVNLNTAPPIRIEKFDKCHVSIKTVYLVSLLNFGNEWNNQFISKTKTFLKSKVTLRAGNFKPKRSKREVS